jgi:hypothetical protein
MFRQGKNEQQKLIDVCHVDSDSHSKRNQGSKPRVSNVFFCFSKYQSTKFVFGLHSTDYHKVLLCTERTLSVQS